MINQEKIRKMASYVGCNTQSVLLTKMLGAHQGG